jgi:hypothetical protein
VIGVGCNTNIALGGFSLLRHSLDVPDSNTRRPAVLTYGFVWFSQIVQEDGGVLTLIRPRFSVARLFKFDYS